jgi:hypothetical protein
VELEIRKAEEIGKAGRSLFVKVVCKDCGLVRWSPISVVRSGMAPLRCQKCAPKVSNLCKVGENNPRWSGGRNVQPSGYIVVRLFPDDPMYSMTVKSGRNKGRVFEHRLVLARHLKRVLEPWEVVHHVNGVRGDNRIENLELAIQAGNVAYARIEAAVADLRQRVASLEQQNRLLKWQVKSLQQGNPVLNEGSYPPLNV